MKLQITTPYRFITLSFFFLLVSSLEDNPVLDVQLGTILSLSNFMNFTHTVIEKVNCNQFQRFRLDTINHPLFQVC